MTDALVELSDPSLMRRAVPRKPFIGASLLALLVALVFLGLTAFLSVFSSLLGYLIFVLPLLAIGVYLLVFHAILRTWMRQLRINISPVRGRYLALTYTVAAVALVGALWVAGVAFNLLGTWVMNTSVRELPVVTVAVFVVLFVLGWAVGYAVGRVIWEFYDQRIIRLLRTGALVLVPAPAGPTPAGPTPAGPTPAGPSPF